MSRISIVILLVIMARINCLGQHTDPFISGIIGKRGDTVLSDKIMYHNVRVDNNGNILPWYSTDPGESYDYVLNRVWEFWHNMDTCENGEKYYINHMIWQTGRHHKDGIGGDQFMMALSSWDLYYNYTGNEEVLEDMKYIADFYLANSLSTEDCEYPYLPYPNNLKPHSGVYNGDMMIGQGFLQLDKAGSFGFELLKLYKKTGDEKYLSAAVNIANTLASKVQKGDNDNSPWPFKVNAKTGEIGNMADPKVNKSTYATFITGTLSLFTGLVELQKGNCEDYNKAFNTALTWMKEYPAKNNKWGPFFEDIRGWSDTQINAITYAMYILEHPELDAEWKVTVKNIIEWVRKELGNSKFLNFGVMPTNEQTAYRLPGNSHSSRQASVELMYWQKTGDTTYVRNAIRQLNWATYMVADDGRNCYPQPDNRIWLTDGYGDYVRHYLRAMAAMPELAPAGKNHLLSSTSVVQKIKYETGKISFTTFDKESEVVLRLASKPKSISVSGKSLKKLNKDGNGYLWEKLENGGVLRLKYKKGNEVSIII